MEELKEEIYTENSTQSSIILSDIENSKTQLASEDVIEENPQSALFNAETQKNSQVALFDEEPKTTPENLEETPNESVEIKNEDANTTNCLALTIQEDHRIVAIKNVFLRSIRMSWKVVVSTITLALIKLFS